MEKVKLILVILVSSLLYGCVSIHNDIYFYLQADGIATQDYKGGQCGSANSSLTLFETDNALIVLSSFMKNISLKITLGKGANIRFTSPDVLIESVDMTISDNIKLTDFSFKAEYGYSDKAPTQQLIFIPTRFDDDTRYRSDFIKKASLENFYLTLPDAYISGKRVNFPKVRASLKTSRYVSAVCLK